MLNLYSEENGNEVVIYLEGKMDTNTSSNVMEEISAYIKDGEKVILDIEKLEYISSAGLRVLVISEQKLRDKGGELLVRNASQTILDIFEITGLDIMLKII